MLTEIYVEEYMSCDVKDEGPVQIFVQSLSNSLFINSHHFCNHSESKLSIEMIHFIVLTFLRHN